MWGLYVNYSRSVVGHMCNVAGICIQGNMPVMWNVHMPVVMVTISFIDFISGRYIVMVVSYVHMK